MHDIREEKEQVESNNGEKEIAPQITDAETQFDPSCYSADGVFLPWTRQNVSSLNPNAGKYKQIVATDGLSTSTLQLP